MLSAYTQHIPAPQQGRTYIIFLRAPAQVFGALVRIKEDAAERSPGAIYVERHPQILRLLFQG